MGNIYVLTGGTDSQIFTAENLRTFARNFFNIDFFLKLLPL